MPAKTNLKIQPASLRGTGVAIVTPFKKDGIVDFKSLENLIKHLIKGKVEYIVALGTTGESVVLNKEEKSAVTKHIIEVVAGRIPVVLGIGGNNTSEVIHALETTDLSGISAILSVCPYYNRPNQEGLYQHFKAIAKASPLPILLYNVPTRTSSNLSAETTLRLAHEFKNIIGIKEASGNFAQVMAIVQDRPKDFLVISGDDLITLPLIACGADGVISVLANAYPKDFSEMVRQALAGNYTTARKLHYKLTTITNLLFADGNPAGIKAALKIMGLTTDYVRLPLVNINEKVYASLEKEIKSYR